MAFTLPSRGLLKQQPERHTSGEAGTAEFHTGGSLTCCCQGF